jgi:hypothetical protein
MEADGARRQRWLDAKHDSAARLRRETPTSEFLDRQKRKRRIIVVVLAKG